MPLNRPLGVLCVASYEKGQEFLRTCKALGCVVYLLTLEKLKDAQWPHECIDEMFYMPLDLPTPELVKAVSYAARTRHIDRIVALDEFDMEHVAALREHLRVPGMGLTTVRYFRDKLAMRAKAREEGIQVPEFSPVVNHADLNDFVQRVPGPWLLKARSQAAGIGLKKVNSAEELWPLLERLGDDQSHYLLEQFVPGRVFHVDSIISERQVVFAEAHAYGVPPLDVSHGGGVFTTRTLARESNEAAMLREMNGRVIEGLGMVRGVTHAEFLRAQADNRYYFIEVAARVGGAYISNVVEAATGVNLWREWAHLEIGAGKQPYQLPQTGSAYGGAIVSLARQEHPDTSGYRDAEIVERVSKFHHAGFVLKSPSAERIETLLVEYTERFLRDFTATEPVPDRPN